MAQYKCLPMYEYVRPGIHVQFNQAGEYFTADPKIIAALDACAPFIQRVDVPEHAEEKPKQRGGKR